MSRTKQTERNRLAAKKHTVVAKRAAPPPPAAKRVKKLKTPAPTPAPVPEPVRRKPRKHAGTGASQRMYQMQKGAQQYVLQKANFRRMALMCLDQGGMGEMRVSKNFMNTLQIIAETIGRCVVRQGCAFVDARGQTKLSRDDLMRCRVVPEVPIRPAWFA